jgi:hypothetical protein
VLERFTKLTLIFLFFVVQKDIQGPKHLSDSNNCDYPSECLLYLEVNS